MIRGRPGRFGVNVHFRAISRRCQRRIVSGVTIVATAAEPAPPRGEASALIVGATACDRHFSRPGGRGPARCGTEGDARWP
jgi:hypothetical protein